MKNLIVFVLAIGAALFVAESANAQFSKAVANPPGLFNRSVAKTRGGFGAASVGPAVRVANVGVVQPAFVQSAFVQPAFVQSNVAAVQFGRPAVVAAGPIVSSGVRLNAFGSVTQQDAFGNVFQVNALGVPVFVGNRFGSALSVQSAGGFVPFVGPTAVGCGFCR